MFYMATAHRGFVCGLGWFEVVRELERGDRQVEPGLRGFSSHFDLSDRLGGSAAVVEGFFEEGDAAEI